MARAGRAVSAALSPREDRRDRQHATILSGRLGHRYKALAAPVDGGTILRCPPGLPQHLPDLPFYDSRACSSALASCKSAVSKPSVNQSQMGASSSQASWRLPCCRHSRLRLMEARSSQDLACWWRATSRAFRKHASASTSTCGLRVRGWGLATGTVYPEPCHCWSSSSPLSRYSSASCICSAFLWTTSSAAVSSVNPSLASCSPPYPSASTAR